MVQAHDAVVHASDAVHMTDAVRRELLSRVTPQKTKDLPSFLPLYLGMRLLLHSKDCVRLGLMKGCPVTLRHIVFSDDEVQRTDLVAGHPHHLSYMPASLVLQAEGAMWTLPESELPVSLPKDTDRRGLFQLRPSCDYLRVPVSGDKYISIRRTAFLVSPADTITVYAAQGGTYTCVIADMQRPPSYTPEQHWLACYVMLSRAKSLDGFLVLRPASRTELQARPPQYLLDELDRQRRLESASLDELLKYIDESGFEVPSRIAEHVLAKDADVREAERVNAHRSVHMDFSKREPESAIPTRRLRQKTALLDAVSAVRPTTPDRPEDGTGSRPHAITPSGSVAGAEGNHINVEAASLQPPSTHTTSSSGQKRSVPSDTRTTERSSISKRPKLDGDEPESSAQRL